MRCSACGAEMMLMNVDRGDTTAALGCEQHIFRCSGCHDVKGHLVFIRNGRESGNPPMLAHAAPPIVPASTAQDGRIGLFGRLVAKIRGSKEATFSAECNAAKTDQAATTRTPIS